MVTQTENLSLLLDDALNAAEAERLLADLQTDAAAGAAWRRYHLARQGLRGETVLAADGDFAARLSRRLAAEPAYARPRRGRREWLRPVGGLALAAALTALAVFTVRQDGITPLPSSDEWVAWDTTAGVQQAGYDGLLSQEKLQAYLVMHSEGMYSAGAGDLLPHTRLVSVVDP